MIFLLKNAARNLDEFKVNCSHHKQPTDVILTENWFIEITAIRFSQVQNYQKSIVCNCETKPGAVT